MMVQLDVSELAKRVRVPALVLRCKGDRVAPLEEGRDMARLIPGASFVELPGNNHALLAWRYASLRPIPRGSYQLRRDACPLAAARALRGGLQAAA